MRFARVVKSARDRVNSNNQNVLVQDVTAPLIFKAATRSFPFKIASENPAIIMRQLDSHTLDPSRCASRDHSHARCTPWKTPGQITSCHNCGMAGRKNRRKNLGLSYKSCQLMLKLRRHTPLGTRSSYWMANSASFRRHTLSNVMPSMQYPSTVTLGR